MMRIAVVTGEYHRRGGFPRHAADLALGFHRIGHEVHVHAMRGAVELAAEDTELTFHPYPWVRRPLLAHMATHPWTVTRRAGLIAGDVDVVISIGIPCLAPVVLVGPGTHRAWYERTTKSLPALSARRWVETVRPFHRIVLGWERAMLSGRHPRLVVVPSEARANDYVRAFGFPSDRIALVPNPLNVEEFRFDPELRTRTRQELGIDPSTLVLLNVARRGRQKGLDVLARALQGLPGTDFCALFAGEGSTAPGLRAITARLREKGKVRLLGRVPEVRSLYCAADLLVFPSRWDPWGLVVTEALASGLPVLCSRDIGAAAAVRPGLNGALLDDPENPDEIAAGIVALLERRLDRDREAVSGTVAHLGREAVATAFVRAVEGSPDRVRADSGR